MSYFPNECFICKAADSLKICGRCNMISYCGWVHQRLDWPKHKEFCNAISSILDENGLSHIYEKQHNSDPDTWRKERERINKLVISALNRPLHLHEDQMILMPRSCFVCHDIRQELLKPCPVCFLANFCEEHPSSSQHDKDCPSLKLFHDLDSKIQNPAKWRIILALVRQIVESTQFENSSDIPNSMKEYLDQKITSGDYVMKQCCTSSMLSMSLTLYNAVKKLNLQSASEMLFHLRCDVPENSVWELLLHFLPDLNFLKIVFVEQQETQTVKMKLCDDCCAKKKKLILQRKEIVYKNYVEDECYKKPDILVYFGAEISKNGEDYLEWRDLLESLSRIGCPLMITSVTEAKAKTVSECLKSTFWPTSICYEGLNDFAALDSLRDWTEGGIGKINQYMIITEGRSSQCKAGILSNVSPLLSKKEAGYCWNPQHFFFSHICRICRIEIVSVMCKYCNMVFYCSEIHRREDWFNHKDLCKVIQKLLTESGMRNIFDGELDLMKSPKTDSESWLQAKLNVLSKVELLLGRDLLVYEQEMFLFPKTCFACHEGDLTRLQTCKCGTILCKPHKEFRGHKSLCRDFDLSFLLIENEQIVDPLPEFNFVSCANKILPSSMQDFLELHITFKNAADVTNVQKIVVAELLTKPLTLLCTMKKLRIPEPENDSTIVVHIVGSKNTGNAYDEFWEVFFHWMQNLDKLNIIFVGSGTKALNYSRSYSFGHESEERNLIMKSYPLEYKQFVQSDFFVKPNIIVGYNLDIHECKLTNSNCSCKENILTIKNLNIPFVMTSGTKERARKDHNRLSAILETSISPDFTCLNPFASLEPVRDFETEGLRYSNKYVLIYSKWTQASTDVNDIFVAQVPNSTRTSELEKKLAELLFTKSASPSTENFDSKKEEEMETVQVSVQGKKLGVQTKNAIEDSKPKEEERVSVFGKGISSVSAASSELKYMLRNLRRGPKSSFETSTSKTKNENQHPQLEKQEEVEPIKDGETNLKMADATEIEIEQDEDLEKKCREIFQGLLSEVETENELNSVENSDDDVIVEMFDPPVIEDSSQISEEKEQDEDVERKMRERELEKQLATIEIKDDAKPVEYLDYKSNVETDNESGIEIFQNISELKKQNKDLEDEISDIKLKEISIEIKAKPEIETAESKAKIETDDISCKEVSEIEITSRDAMKSESKIVNHSESDNAPEIQIYKPIEQNKKSEEKLRNVFPVSENVLEIATEIKEKPENSESKLKSGIESGTKIETESLSFKKLAEFENIFETTKSESKSTIENLQRESKLRFEDFDAKPEATEIKSVTKSPSTENCEGNFQFSFRSAKKLGDEVKNSAKPRTQIAEFITENLKLKREKLSKSRNLFPNVLAASSELRFMLKTLGSDSKSSNLENSESKTKKIQILEEAPNFVQNSQLEKGIVKIQTHKSEMQSAENSDHENKEQRIEMPRQQISEPNENGEALKKISSKVSPVLVSISDNTFSSVLTANSKLDLNEATNDVDDSNLEKQVILNSKSKMELDANPDYGTNAELVTLPVSEKELKEITIENISKLENLEYEAKLDIEDAEFTTESETGGLNCKQVPEFENNINVEVLKFDLSKKEEGLKDARETESFEEQEHEEKPKIEGADSKTESETGDFKCKQVSEFENKTNGEVSKSELNRKEEDLKDIGDPKPFENPEHEKKPKIEDVESKMAIEMEVVNCKKVSESEMESPLNEEATKLEVKLPKVFPVIEIELKDMPIKNQAKPDENLESKAKPWIDDTELKTRIEIEDVNCKKVSESEMESPLNEEATKFQVELPKVFPVIEIELKDMPIKNQAKPGENLESKAKPRIDDTELKTRIEIEDVNCKKVSESEMESPLNEEATKLEVKLPKVFPVIEIELKDMPIKNQAKPDENLESKAKPRIDDTELKTRIEIEDVNCKKVSESEKAVNEEAWKLESNEQEENSKVKLPDVLPVFETEMKDITIDNQANLVEIPEYEEKPKIEDTESQTEIETEVVNCRKVSESEDILNGEATKSEVSQQDENSEMKLPKVLPVFETELKDIKIETQAKPDENLESKPDPNIEDTESKTRIETEDLNSQGFSEFGNTSSEKAAESEPNNQSKNCEEQLPEVFSVLVKKLKDLTIEDEAEPNENPEYEEKIKTENPESETAIKDLNCKKVFESKNTSCEEATESGLNKEDEDFEEKLPVLEKESKEIAVDIEVKSGNPKRDIKTTESETTIEAEVLNCKTVSEFDETLNGEAAKSPTNEQGEDSKEKLTEVLSDLEKELEKIKIDNEINPDGNLESQPKPRIEDPKSKTAIEFKNLNCKKVSESNTSSEETAKSESRQSLIENLEHESKPELAEMESKMESTENKSMTQSSTVEDSEPSSDELFIANLLLKEEIRRLKKNEELVKSENLRLKEEVRRLRKEYNLI